jgi:hypothetical protein
MTECDPRLDGAITGWPEVTFNAKGKLVLPEIPDLGDVLGECRWLTVVFNLDPHHPVKGAELQGRRGSDGHVVMRRVDAPDITFAPAAVVNTALKLVTELSWQKLPSDGQVHPLMNEHCRAISHVLRMLCDDREAMTRAQEADAILATYTATAIPVEGRTTYGTAAQRYDAAVALRREVSSRGQPIGSGHYLIDADTGELVVQVSDLQDAARRYEGESLARGWLDAMMDEAGFKRVTLDGHAEPGRAGRQGRHVRVFAYRGHRLTAGDEA